MTRKLLILLVFIVSITSIILAGCTNSSVIRSVSQQPVQPEPVPEPTPVPVDVPEPEPACDSGFKLCGEECIPEDGCCSNDECESFQVCQSNECILKEDILCDVNAFFDDDRGKCVCEPNKYFCNDQKQCIDLDVCCNRFDCPRSEACAETRLSMYFCFEKNNTILSCKFVTEGLSSLFSFEGSEYTVSLDELYQDEIADIRINNDTFSKITVNDVKQIDGMDTYIEYFKTFGGTCFEYE